MSAGPSEDCAWVTVPVPFGPDELRHWLDDVETLFRINSLLEISGWLQDDDGQHVQLVGRNLSNEQPLNVQMRLTQGEDGGLLIQYADGLKRSTAFAIEPAETTGFQLRITDDYSGLSEEERKDRVDEVDRSLPQWGRDIYKYFTAWKRWSWLAPWRWYMTGPWLRMKPSARRITRWIWWIAVGELVAFLLVFGVLVIEQG